MAIYQADSGEDDGVVLGRSGGKLGFYGLATAIVKPSVTWPNTTTATTALNELKANRLKNALVALGLIVTT